MPDPKAWEDMTPEEQEAEWARLFPELAPPAGTTPGVTAPSTTTPSAVPPPGVSAGSPAAVIAQDMRTIEGEIKALIDQINALDFEAPEYWRQRSPLDLQLEDARGRYEDKARAYNTILALEQKQNKDELYYASKAEEQRLKQVQDALALERERNRDELYYASRAEEQRLKAIQDGLSNDLEKGRLSFDRAQAQFEQQLLLSQQRLAQQRALAEQAGWAAPEGMTHFPGFEPGGALDESARMLGYKYTPIPITRIPYNPMGDLPSPTIYAETGQATPADTGTEFPAPGVTLPEPNPSPLMAWLRKGLLSSASPAGGGNVTLFPPGAQAWAGPPRPLPSPVTLPPPGAQAWSGPPRPLPSPDSGGNIGDAEFPTRTPSAGFYASQPLSAGNRLVGKDWNSPVWTPNVPSNRVGNTTFYWVNGRWTRASDIPAHG